MLLRLLASILITCVAIFNVAAFYTAYDRQISWNAWAGIVTLQIVMFYVGYWIVTGELLWT